ERLSDNAAAMGTRLFEGLKATFGNHPHVGDIRGGKGLLAALELVEDRATKKNFAGDRKVAPRAQTEMMKRGLVTRTRPAPGPHPAPGDSVFFAPPLVVTAAEIDRTVAITRDAIKAVLGVQSVACDSSPPTGFSSGRRSRSSFSIRSCKSAATSSATGRRRSFRRPWPRRSPVGSPPITAR